MGFALGGQQRAMLPNDLFEDGNPIRTPKLLTLIRGQERIVRPREYNHGVSKRGNLVREQGLHLTPRSRDSRGPIRLGLGIPSAVEDPDNAACS